MSNRNYEFELNTRKEEKRVFFDVQCSKIRTGNQYTGTYILHLTIDDAKTLQHALEDALFAHKHQSLIRILEGEEDGQGSAVGRPD